MAQQKEPFAYALSGQYQLSIKSLFERANSLTKNNFGPMLQGFLVLIAFMFVSISLFSSYFGVETIEQLSSLPEQQVSLMNITLTLVIAPIIAGLFMLAIKNARGKKTSVKDTFAYFSQTIMLALASLLVSILTTLGLALFILPGVYIYLTTKLALPLIADAKLSPLQAVIMSIKICHKYVFHLLVIMLVFVALMFLVVMTLGLAFVWVGPLYFNVFGVLYTDLMASPDDTLDMPVQTGADGRFDA